MKGKKELIYKYCRILIVFTLISNVLSITVISSYDAIIGTGWTDINFQRKLARTDNGTLYCVWYDDDGDIQFGKSFDNGLTWDTTELSGDSGVAEVVDADQGYPSIAIDSNNNISVVWNDDVNYVIHYSKSSDGGATWSPSVNLTNVGGDHEVPTIAVDSNDVIYIAYTNYTGAFYTIGFMKSTDWGGTWSTPTNITQGDPYDDDWQSMALDSNDTIHLVFECQDNDLSKYCIRYTNSTDGGDTWASAINLTVSQYVQYEPCMAIDSSDNVHVVWDGKIDGGAKYWIRYANFTNTEWSDPLNLTIDSGAGGCQYPSISIDANDDIYVVCENYPTISCINFTGGTWQTAYNFSGLGYPGAPISLWAKYPSSNILDESFYFVFMDSEDLNNVTFYSFDTPVYTDVYVDDDADPSWYNVSNVKTIQEGVANVSVDGTVHIWDGTYTENIVVSKSIDIVGNGTSNVFVVSPSGSPNGMMNISSNWVNVSSLNFSGIEYANTYGVGITGSNVTVSDCSIRNCSRNGVDVYSNYDTNLSSLLIFNCSTSSGYSGINGYNANNLFIDDCNINHIYRVPFGSVSSTAFGITLDTCSNILVNNSNFSNIKSHNSYSYGLRAYDSTSNITIRNCNFSNGQIGVYIGDSDNITIEDSDFIDHVRGTGLGEPFIKLIECIDVLIDNNTCDNNDHYTGFIFTDIAEFTISNNDVENILDDAYGMLINSVSWDWETSEYNKNGLIFNNSIENTTDIGLSLGDYDNITIYNNMILDCGNEAGEYGVYFSGDGNITFYNNYVDNDANIYSTASNAVYNITKTLGTNIIGGHYLGGNYWSDYAGVDTDNDGLGNTLLPYDSNGGIP